MYECRNCGAGLRFDITTQQLKCDACDSLFDPYGEKKEQDAIEDQYEVNLFLCPQCGGAVISDDNTIADFCSFCGQTVIMTNRMTKEKRPKRIIPFARTRQDCRKQYGAYMRRAIYAPDDLKNPESIEAFRGIYIPYWRYLFHREQTVRLHGKVRKGSQNELCTYEAKIEGETAGVAFDASSYFDDRINERIGSFDPADAKEFTPSYLCGFYGDLADVGQEIYEREAKQTDDGYVREFVAKEAAAKEHGVAQKEFAIGPALSGTQETEVESMLCPVWFLSYRMGERVAYATVNGQTGKITADMPVDYKKFAIGCSVTALILFSVLNLFFTMKPETAVVLASVLLAVGLSFYAREMRELFGRIYYVDDKGYGFGKKVSEKQREHYAAQKQKYQETVLLNLGEILFSILAVVLALFIEAGGVLMCIAYVLVRVFGAVGNDLLPLWLVAAGLNVIYLINSFRFIKIMDKPDYKGVAGAIAALVVSGAILLINPVSDLYFYFGVIAVLLAVLFLCVDLIAKYNQLSTHIPPQFEAYQGGDSHVR